MNPQALERQQREFEQTLHQLTNEVEHFRQREQEIPVELSRVQTEMREIDKRRDELRKLERELDTETRRNREKLRQSEKRLNEINNSLRELHKTISTLDRNSGK